MSFLDEYTIEPKIGIGPLKIGMNIEDTFMLLKEKNVSYSVTTDLNKGCTPAVPWKSIIIKNYISLIFAKDILWRIDCEKDFKGKLPNGIGIGSPLNEAEKKDLNLKYDDWNEDFYSTNGYWIVDSIETGLIQSISIGIEEINDDSFYTYDWVDRYK